MSETGEFPSAADFVRSLRSSDEAYESAAAQEGKVWGRMFSNAQMNAARLEDQDAARVLGIPESRLSLAQIARQQGWQFDRGVSLACGSGRAERQLIKMGVSKSFLGLDIAPAALDEARKQASQENLDIEYKTADLNRLSLPRGEFELVVTQNCLHHVLELERLAEEIWLSLKPGGYLWIDDFIGESQFQWSDKRLHFANGLLAALPAKYKVSRLNGAALGPFRRRPPGTLVSPFEAIRSAEIVPIFERYFEIIVRHEWDAVLQQLLCPVGFRAAYAEGEEGRHLFSLLRTIDTLLVETQTLPPLGGQYVMKRKSTPEVDASDRIQAD